MSKKHEKEGKIIDINKDEVKEAINAKFEDAVLYSNHRVLRTVRMVNESGEKIRLRDDGFGVKVEHKGGKKREEGVKSAMETGMNICSMEAGIAVFTELGFEAVLEDTKKRTRYVLDFEGEEVIIEIDEYTSLGGIEDIPSLLEIEASSREVIVRVAEILGFSESHLKDWGTTKLIKHYRPDKKSKVGKIISKALDTLKGFKKLKKKLKKKKS